MTNKKQEELKKLLASTDFQEESYAGLTMQELIALKNSARVTKEKNLKNAQIATFFTKREEFFLHLLLRRVQGAETIYALFARATNLPYVCCDPNTYNDQVWIFSSELIARNAAGKEKDRQLMIVKLENKQFLAFFLSLFSMGINEFVIDRTANSVAVPLEALVKKPDYSGLPAEKQPVLNPELLLTAVYFAQERALPQESVNMESLREQEEEMLVNLQRGKVLLPVQVPEGSDEKVQLKDMRLPVMKLPNGDAYQPVCTDPNEFQRFNAKNQFRAVTVDCEKLRGLLGKETKGVLLNPTTVRLAIPRAKLG